MTPEMSNRDTHLTKQRKYPQFVTPICQINCKQDRSEVTAICQIVTADWQVMTALCHVNSVVVCRTN